MSCSGGKSMAAIFVGRLEKNDDDNVHRRIPYAVAQQREKDILDEVAQKCTSSFLENPALSAVDAESIKGLLRVWVFEDDSAVVFSSEEGARIFWDCIPWPLSKMGGNEDAL